MSKTTSSSGTPSPHRRRWLPRAAIGAVFGLAAAAAVAFFPEESAAQLAEGGGPISYQADTLEYSEADSRLILTGAVDLVQGDARLRANRLTIFFRPGSSDANQGVGSGDIDRMIAEGEVYYIRPTQHARGDRAVYETSSDTVTFTGNVVVASDDNVIRGQTLVLQVSAGRTTVSAQDGRRVQGVVNTSRP
jgi:lipopolysaccharide export system protein LptA